MRNNTRRALRATATVAGVAALAGTFTGTAFADSGLGGLGGSDSFGGSDNYGGSDSSGLGSLGDSDGTSIFNEPGLGSFEMPGLSTGSRGFRTSSDNPFDDFTGGGDDYGYDGDSDYSGHFQKDHCKNDDSYSHRDEHGVFQSPVQCKHNNIFKHLVLEGHDYNSSYKSIGSRGMRTDGGFGGFGDFGGSDGNYGSDQSYGSDDFGGGMFSDMLNSHSGRSDSHSYGNESDGLSGHNIKLPFST